MKTKKRITVRTQTEDGEWTSRRVSVPSDALRDGQRTHANEVGTGIYETDTYISPRGIVIARMYSCWDDGRGACEGVYYQEITDPIRLADEFGIERM
jgi:hypothetical protein